MKIVHLFEPPAPSTRHEVEDVRDFFVSHSASWPRTARIYHGELAQDRDVTPADEAGIALLGALPGPFYVVISPGSVEDLLWVVPPLALGYQSLKFAQGLLLPSAPQIPGAAAKNTQTSSPNNDPFNRQNQGRPFARIPDIFGTVRSVPDLLAAPYKIFVGASEIEHSYYCIGRGSYDVSNIRDGSTSIEQIPGLALQVFGPSTSPNSGSPQVQVGDDITEPFRSAKRYGSVDGQTLQPPNKRITSAWGENTIGFNGSSGSIVALAGSGIDFTEFVEPGDAVVVDADHMYPDLHTVPLDGSYVVTAVSELNVTLSAPASVNAEWANLPTGTYWATLGAQLDTSRYRYVGPFFCDATAATQVLLNVVAPQGLYRIDGASGANQGKQLPKNIILSVESAPCTDGVNPIGSWVPFGMLLAGSSTSKTQVGVTGAISISGPCLIRARRVTEGDFTSVGAVVDEVKWRDLYQVTPVTALHFGDVTTIRMALPRTRAAIYDRERKLNMLATRKVLHLGTGALVASRRVDDIFTHVCFDSRIGRRTLAELDMAGIYAAIAEAEDYFGTPRAVEFNGTLDKDGMSFEETAAAIAAAACCAAYRQGSQIKIKFEKETDDSVLLFNHRNKVPGTESRSVSFGNADSHDGVEYQFIDPDRDDELSTLYLPSDQSAMNPQKIESLGVRNRLQAYFLAQRAWNRIRYQSVALECEVTQEADILVQADRILVADGTRLDYHQGEVREQAGLALTLSQPVAFASGKAYTLFAQLSDGTVQAIGVSAGSAVDEVVLATAPRLPLVTDPANFAVTTYWLVADDDSREHAFLLTEKEPRGRLTSIVRAVNYDARYYQADRDYLDGVVDEDGYPV